MYVVRMRVGKCINVYMLCMYVFTLPPSTFHISDLLINKREDKISKTAWRQQRDEFKRMSTRFLFDTFTYNRIKYVHYTFIYL